jgi:hypothetical protein
MGVCLSGFLACRGIIHAAVRGAIYINLIIWSSIYLAMQHKFSALTSNQLNRLVSLGRVRNSVTIEALRTKTEIALCLARHPSHGAMGAQKAVDAIQIYRAPLSSSRTGLAFGWIGTTSGLASVVRKLKTKCLPTSGAAFVPLSPSHSVHIPAKIIWGRLNDADPDGAFANPMHAFLRRRRIIGRISHDADIS